MKFLKNINERLGTGNFIAVLTQAGEGCDYTIGCGIRSITLESENIDDAHEELNQIILEEYSGERSLSNAILYKVESSDKVDLKSLYQRQADEKRQRRESQEEKKEREDFERLSKKYGNKQ